MDRRQESDAVAAEVVEQRRMAQVGANHPDAASHIAHQPMPLEVVALAPIAQGLAKGRMCSSIYSSIVPGKASSRTQGYRSRLRPHNDQRQLFRLATV